MGLVNRKTGGKGEVRRAMQVEKRTSKSGGCARRHVKTTKEEEAKDKEKEDMGGSYGSYNVAILFFYLYKYTKQRHHCRLLPVCSASTYKVLPTRFHLPTFFQHA